MGLAWSLNLLVYITGISSAAAAALLLTGIGRVGSPERSTRAAIGLLIVAMALLLGAIFVPPLTISSYWFLLSALPMYVPAVWLLGEPASPQGGQQALPQTQTSRRANRGGDRAASAMPTEFSEYLKKIPEVLAAHPEGLTLVEIGRQLDVEWRRLTGAARELIEQDRIYKAEKRYFLRSESESDTSEART
jgi:hypothetical protein